MLILSPLTPSDEVENGLCIGERLVFLCPQSPKVVVRMAHFVSSGLAEVATKFTDFQEYLSINTRVPHKEFGMMQTD